MKVAIILGSSSDVEVMKGAGKALKEFGVEYKAYVLSAHRVSEELLKRVKSLEDDGFEAVIAGAGLAAHLSGVIAANTILPVVGVPIKAAFEGLDSLLSMVQMPKPVPVAVVGLNNSYNAGMLCIEMLALKYPELNVKLKEYRKKIKSEFLENNKEVEL